MSHVVIYTRFSPRRNADESESCGIQEQICRAHAEEQGWTVRAVHHDKAISGKVWPREGLTAALGDLKRGDVLLVYRRDRIARRPLISETVEHFAKRIGARTAAVEGDLTSESDSPEAELIRRIIEAVAAYERKLTGARTSAALLQKQRNGKRVSNIPAYGRKVDPDDPKRTVDNEDELVAVDRIKELAAEGATLYRIRKIMNAEHPELARGKEWGFKTLKKILKRN